MSQFSSWCYQAKKKIANRDSSRSRVLPCNAGLWNLFLLSRLRKTRFRWRRRQRVMQYLLEVSLIFLSGSNVRKWFRSIILYCLWVCEEHKLVTKAVFLVGFYIHFCSWGEGGGRELRASRGGKERIELQKSSKGAQNGFFFPVKICLRNKCHLSPLWWVLYKISKKIITGKGGGVGGLGVLHNFREAGYPSLPLPCPCMMLGLRKKNEGGGL